ncbi:MAG: hypothetical protein ACHQU0_01330 [Candidatus Paceibacteria bacterium]
MNTFKNTTPSRQAAVNGLAVTGFIALMTLGMWLAVYSTRFVPTVVGRIGTAAVYLGSVFTPASSPSVAVVPNASSTIISFGESTSTPAASTTTTTTEPAPTPKQVPTTAGTKTDNVYQIGGATTTPTVTGLPDLIATIKAVGYLSTTTTDSFIATTTVPNGNRPAVVFTIKNVGGSATGPWRFSASIPTQTAYIYQSQPQQSLNPGDSIDYTLGFDEANKGANQMISITANFDHAVTESTVNNNSASASVTVLGS